jgi:hypothetical protein
MTVFACELECEVCGVPLPVADAVLVGDEVHGFLGLCERCAAGGES